MADPLDQIKRLAGKSYKEPKQYKQLSGACFKAQDEVEKSMSAFHAERDTLAKALVDLQTKLAKLKYNNKALQNSLSDETYGIDATDKKTIAQAQGIFDKVLDDAIDSIDDDEKKLDELEKHMMNIMKYKGPST